MYSAIGDNLVEQLPAGGMNETEPALHYHDEHDLNFNRTDGFPTEAFGFRCNRLRTVDTVIFHPAGSFVEFPFTSDSKYIAHIFELDINEVRNETYIHPRKNLAYGLGPPKGSHEGVTCELLRNDQGVPVMCRHESVTCQGVKVCEFSDIAKRKIPHVNASRDDVIQRLCDDVSLVADATSKHILRQKTVAMKAALDAERCNCELGDALQVLLSPQERREHDHWLDQTLRLRRGQPLNAKPGNYCPGRMVLDRDKKGDPFVRCEYSSKEYKFHRTYYPEFFGVDVSYLEALFSNNHLELDEVEEEERLYGWGPRASCRVVANSKSVKTHCPLQHRKGSDGDLKHGELISLPCTANFQIYTPYHLSDCPRIVILVTGKHCHPVPLPVDTPQYVKRIIVDLLHSLDTDLADATPRRFMRHPLVQAKLKILCPTVKDPTLADLHVSLSNRDKIRRYIDAVKLEKYPFGTGWEGLKDYKLRQDAIIATPLGSREDLYIRHIEEIDLEDENTNEDNIGADATDSKDGPLRLVICMTPAQSRRFLEAIFIQSDIAFKRTPNYYEFEIVTWHEKTSTSVTLVRAFLTRQTANAHRILFHRIDQIIRGDTGHSLRWRHLHSPSLLEEVGILMWTTDQHLGQANGIGLYLFDIAQGLPDSAVRSDLHEPNRAIKSLTRDDHLKRILRLCVVHLQRNIKTCKTTDEVKRLMRSLICYSHEDYDGTIRSIRELGGKHAAAWCDNKVGLVPPAMCGEKSFIPEHIWHAGDSNTNLSEVSHADVNREGTGCTLLGACIRGQRFDITKERTIRSAEECGVGAYDMLYTDERRATKALKRKQHARVRTLESQDKEIQAALAHLSFTEGRLAQLNASLDASKDRLQLERRKRNTASLIGNAKGKKRKRKGSEQTDRAEVQTPNGYNDTLLAAERNVASATLEVEKAMIQFQKAQESISKLKGSGSGRFSASLATQSAPESPLASKALQQELEDLTAPHFDNFEASIDLDRADTRPTTRASASHNSTLDNRPPPLHEANSTYDSMQQIPARTISASHARTAGDHLSLQQNPSQGVQARSVAEPTALAANIEDGTERQEVRHVQNPNFNPAYYRRVY